MEDKTTKIEKIVIGVCIGLLVFFAVTIAVRVFTRQLLIEYFDIDNAFTEFVWFDNTDELTYKENAISDSENIKWENEYPFDNSKSNLNIDEKASKKEISNSILEKTAAFLTSFVADVKYKIESYATERIIFYSKIVAGAYAYEQYVGWNLASYGEYNGVTKLSNDYLVTFIEKKDTSQQYDALLELNEFCQNIGIDFLYVQAPYKISEYDDAEVSGKVDFSNQNADVLLTELGESGIEYYDLRETIHEQNLDNHDLFYKTDHHWLTTTGLWASQNILAFCNDTYGWNADLSLLDADQFVYKTYKDWFLGSQGRKVTLANCQPDDFILFYPKYETSLYYYVPDKGIDTIADYSVTFNMSEIDTCDYYNKNPYSGCNYGSRPLIRIENQMGIDEHKILIIRDSFANCMLSCLALAEKNIDSLDIRNFTGSVKAYIEECNPDLVIVMYNVGMVGGEIDYSTHKDAFDFR